jgi:exopolysaccharide biosynthesis polyprenyl glycosylphosphotransferase
MIKYHHTKEIMLLILSDIVSTLIAWTLAYHIRFEWMSGAQQGLMLFFFGLSPVICLLCLASFFHHGFYRSYRFLSLSEELRLLVKSNTISFMAILVLFYFFAQDKISRLMLLTFFILLQFFSLSFKILSRKFFHFVRAQGKNLHHYLLIGDGPQMKKFIQTIEDQHIVGLKFMGWIDADPHDLTSSIPRIQSHDFMKKHERPDGIIIGYTGEKSHLTQTWLERCYNDVLPVVVLPDLSYAFVGHHIGEFHSIPFISINKPNLHESDVFIKRSFDIFCSGIGLMILSPLFLSLALLVKCTSSGPIFYAQERMGLDGRLFRMWKFRSMKQDAEKQSGAVWCVEDDPRRTKLGSFLRSSSLDELPQLWNVFRGDMSLVGPRPERPIFVQKFRQEIPAYMLRHKMKAGITGLAQIKGWRGNTSLEKRIECDIYYIKHWSLFLDIKILILTFFKGIFHKNAY